jgi:TM2 domain-containing membrane protein YozV
MYIVIGSDGVQYGPVDAHTLQSWATTGRINANTQITNMETGEQTTAARLPFLKPDVIGSPTDQPLYIVSGIQIPGMIQVPAGTHSVGTAVILALLITGLGQVYNKQAMKGLLILLASVILAAFTCGVSILLTHPFAFIDALMIAQRLNRGEAVREWQCF